MTLTPSFGWAVRNRMPVCCSACKRLVHEGDLFHECGDVPLEGMAIVELPRTGYATEWLIGGARVVATDTLAAAIGISSEELIIIVRDMVDGKDPVTGVARIAAQAMLIEFQQAARDA